MSVHTPLNIPADSWQPALGPPPARAAEGIPSEACSPPPAAPLLAWQTCPPDGSPARLEQLAARLGQVWGGAVSLGFRWSGGELEHSPLAADRPATCEHGDSRSGLQAALAEATELRAACRFATASSQNSLVLQRLRQLTQAHMVLSFGGGAPAGVVESQPTSRLEPHEQLEQLEQLELGIVVCVPTAADVRSKQVVAGLIAQTQRELAEWLRVWCRCRDGRRAANWQRRWQRFRGRQGRWTLLAAGLLLAALALPLPYWPQRPCVIEPAKKSFVSSPIDGRIRQASVRPGDVVVAGQLLARLDGEALQWQLSAAEAEYAAAHKKRDSALATRSAGELRLAQLEQERIEVQLESLQRQLERLELRSPIDGIVVQGDWYQSDGAPVTRGDMLFEIAEMDRMQVEIHLSTDDLAEIELGQPATIRVDAAPGAAWRAPLARIDPRGQVIDTEVVFEAAVEVENPSHELRPGMRGTARISAGTHSLGWLLFYRPWMWAMKKLAW